MSHDNETSHAHFDNAQADLDSLCAMCNSPTTNTCSSCKGANYCSKICQKSDWPLHKLCCKLYSLYAMDPNVTNMVRSIIFPAGEKGSARPVVMITPLYGDSQIDRLRVADWKEYFGIEEEDLDEAEEMIETLRITRNPLRRRDLRGPGTSLGEIEIYKGHALVVHMRKDRQGFPPNKALLACAQASGVEFPSPLRGPVLMLREEISDSLFRNCTLQDFRDMFDYLRLHGTEDENGLSYAKLEKAPVMGASISCWGEVMVKKSNPVVPALIPEAHPILNGAGDGSRIAKILGLPITMWKAPETEYSRTVYHGYAFCSNDNAVILQVDCKEKSKAWGQAPDDWKTDLGNVLVVRNDGKDFDPLVLQIMTSFARGKLQHMFKAVTEQDNGGKGEQTRKEILDYITWENMMKWRELMQKAYGDEF